MALSDEPGPCAVCGVWMGVGAHFYWLLPNPPQRPERLLVCADCWTGKRGQPAWDMSSHTGVR